MVCCYVVVAAVIHGAGGMVLVDPLFQRILVQECHKQNIPVIFDEVFAGCWRLGVQVDVFAFLSEDTTFKSS